MVRLRINLPRFASICYFCYIFNNPHRKSKPCKSCENTANQGISGGEINMISILFVCHGSILKCSGKASKINDFVAGYGIYYTTITPFFERALE